MALDLDDPRPAYVQLADDLRRAVASGKYGVGERLPAVRTLAQQWGVANATAARAVELLRRDGVVVSRSGVGTVVRATGSTTRPPLQEQVDDLRRRVEALEAGPPSEP